MNLFSFFVDFLFLWHRISKMDREMNKYFIKMFLFLQKKIVIPLQRGIISIPLS